ncbi:MAG: carboxymuconolactone decarboxylase family protein [Alcaligenaceae bacterium]|uniref:Carboxymuconolactone decarboxylase family protein n=1 Tax=Paenalcaligenes hermetiae TaxID=1157987 RepID=A0ABP9M1B2_9BURK|nr:carboxymuconolactone decarboxylase family protein [Paenalcaligenes sp.]NLJ61906.1 carboxymuconolactone decarboxylase family protein [Alcaligenaceae bacterium]
MSFKDLTAGLSKEMAAFGKNQPEVMGHFSKLAQSASKDGTLDAKTKEFIALGIAIAIRCDACIGFHVQALVKLGVTREEFDEVINTAVYMGGGPSLMYGMKAQQAFNEFSAA